MIRQAIVRFLVLMGMYVFSSGVIFIHLQAQELGGGSSFKTSGRTADAAPVSISEDALAYRGFYFDDQRRPMCKISGSEGTCRVEAFIFGETRNDKDAYTCGKLDRSTYVGHCVDGKLDGLSLVIADGKKKAVREAFLSYFSEGRIAYPALKSYLSGDSNFGVREKRSSYGCVYFGKWDESTKRCAKFIEIYGRDLFTDSNAQKLRSGTFDLDYYRTKFLEFVQRQ